MAAGDYAFGSFNLADNVNYVVTKAEPPGVPVDLKRLPLARREGSIMSLVRFQEHIAQVTGMVKSTVSFSDCETKKDTLLLNLYNDQQNLKLGYQDERYWKSRLTGEPTFKRITPALYEYQAAFLVLDAFAYALNAATPVTDNTALTADGGGSYHKDISVTPAGTAPARPTLTVVVPAGGPYGLTSIKLTNLTVTPNVAITIARTYAANDTLVINTDAFTCQVGITTVDFSGSLNLLFDPRAGATNVIRVTALAASLPTLNCTFAWTPRLVA